MLLRLRMQVASARDDIRNKKQMMLLAPSETPMELEIKKFRQAAYKYEFIAKRKSCIAGSYATTHQGVCASIDALCYGA